MTDEQFAAGGDACEGGDGDGSAGGAGDERLSVGKHDVGRISLEMIGRQRPQLLGDLRCCSNHRTAVVEERL
ncbi:unannotated protein [freshwater metagenome]|uniref:Unannotated protein n=1 Tax=freshwater metagenome TaxID=449393 RepID=A0A6J7A4I1_9ZZZZ